MRLHLLAVVALVACTSEERDFTPSGGMSPGVGGGGGGGVAAGSTPLGGEGEEEPVATTTTGADISGSDLTLWTESDTERLEVVLHLDGQLLPGLFTISGLPDEPARPEGTLTLVGPPVRVFQAMQGQVDLTTCPGAEGDRAKGAWRSVKLDDVGSAETRTVDGSFDLKVRTAQVSDIGCVAGAPAEGEGEGEGEAPCPIDAQAICPAGAAAPCCPFRQQVDNCHEECSFGACRDPRGDGCPPCLEGCIQNIVDAACRDRYIPLSRCQFAAGCVGANDPALTCTLQACCDELGAALADI